ncbi:Coiled-coil domain-containing protein 13 [Phytophthora ramorum]|uniref:Coiled-coil domain-containing protein 13 n=1 Tax=Phytophthora ramorum TaxID=164328 RepID=UPI00309C9C01|nr:Coiled-coil domain-containing protein 13 [Phytophthora ramorum]
MEAESTRVHIRPDGKKLIDVTLRRQGVPPEQAPLVVPRFDDEDDSSSDSSDDEEPAAKPSFLLSKNRHPSGGSNNNDEDDHGESTNDGQSRQDRPQHTFQGDVQWDRVQELQELTNANAALTSEARDLRQQLKTLQIQLEAQAPVPGLDVDAVQDILLEKDNIEHDVRDVKIVHQARMVRTLKLSLQREKQLAADAIRQCKEMKSTSTNLEEEVDTLKLKLQRFQARAAADKANPTGITNQSQLPELSTPSLTDGGNDSGALKKLCEELKSKNTALQQELKKIQRALVREVGDDVPLEDIVGNTDSTASGASRRGRAQHIIMLKAKVKKLQTQLATVKSGADIDTQDSGATTTVLDVDQRAQQGLSGQHMHRQKLLDQLTGQRDELQERVHRLTRKYDALKARAQTLDREKQETRNKFQVLVEKSRTDDALVDALQRQLETWKTKLNEARRARTADGMKGSASQEERAELERLRKIVAEHKSRGSDRTVNPMGLSNGVMPQLSEASQYRAIAAEKERLAEVVRGLKAQLEDKDNQLRSMHQQRDNAEVAPQTPTQAMPSSPSLPPIGDESVSRIPRRPGSKLPLPSGRLSSVVPPAPSAVMMEQQQQQLKLEMETLRKTFRDSMRDKDERIAELEQQQRSIVQSASGTADVDMNAMNQELQDLQEENDFLRQEFDKLKTRYEALVKPSSSSSKKRNSTSDKKM